MKKLIIYIALFTSIVTACDDKKTSSQPKGALPIEVAEPVVKNVVLTKDYPGFMDSQATVDVMGRVNGILLSSNYKAGMRVKKGELLFVIEPDLYEDAVQQAEADLKTAVANLDYARNNFVRMKEAIKSDAVSKIQYLQAESDMAKSEAAVSSAKAALSTAKINLSYCYIRATSDGYIDIAIPSVGGYISGGTQPVKMATIYKNDYMYAYFNIADNHYLASNKFDGPGAIPKDYYVMVTIGEDSVYKWKARLDYLSPTVTLSTGTLRLRAEITNPKGILKKGMYVTITLPYGEQNNAILIDDESISSDQLGNFIYVVNDSNIVKYRPIKVGQRFENNMRIVNEGLKPGEKYVTKALLKVRDGMVIQPIMPGENMSKMKKQKNK